MLSSLKEATLSIFQECLQYKCPKKIVKNKTYTDLQKHHEKVFQKLGER